MAVEILQEFFRDHTISIITARPVLFREVTIQWLERVKIRYNHIVFTDDKLTECVDSKVDVLIDDGPHYAEQFALENRPIILLSQPYNMHVANPLVYRASNWSEVKGLINHLESGLV